MGRWGLIGHGRFLDFSLMKEVLNRGKASDLALLLLSLLNLQRDYSINNWINGTQSLIQVEDLRQSGHVTRLNVLPGRSVHNWSKA